MVSNDEELKIPATATDPSIHAMCIVLNATLKSFREIQGKTKIILRKKISYPSFLEILQII